MSRFDGKGVVLGAVALVAAVLLFGTLLVDAVRSQPGESTLGASAWVAQGGAEDGSRAAPEAGGARAEVLTANGTQREEPPPQLRPSPASDALPSEVLRLAAQRAPFSPDRTPPAERYRMPGDPAPRVSRPAPELPPAPDFRLLATIANDEGGGVAVVQVGDEPPRVVEVGEQMMGYHLASIDGGGAVMAGPGRALNLLVAGPSPTGPAPEEDSRSRRQREREAQVEEAQRRAVQMRAIQQLQNQMREQGGRVEVRGDQIIITGPDGQRRLIQMSPGGAMQMQTPPERLRMEGRMSVEGTHMSVSGARISFPRAGGGGDE